MIRCPICSYEKEDVKAHLMDRRMKGGHGLGPIEADRFLNAPGPSLGRTIGLQYKPNGLPNLPKQFSSRAPAAKCAKHGRPYCLDCGPQVPHSGDASPQDWGCKD